MPRSFMEDSSHQSKLDQAFFNCAQAHLSEVQLDAHENAYFTYSERMGGLEIVKKVTLLKSALCFSDFSLSVKENRNALSLLEVRNESSKDLLDLVLYQNPKHYVAYQSTSSLNELIYYPPLHQGSNLFKTLAGRPVLTIEWQIFRIH
jgi:hypothetical protein